MTSVVCCLGDSSDITITDDVSMETMEALESERDSPAPQWDEPLPLVSG